MHHEGYRGKYQNLRVKLDGGRPKHPDQMKLLIGVGMVTINDEWQGDFVAPWTGYTDETETFGMSESTCVYYITPLYYLAVGSEMFRHSSTHNVESITLKVFKLYWNYHRKYNDNNKALFAIFNMQSCQIGMCSGI